MYEPSFFLRIRILRHKNYRILSLKERWTGRVLQRCLRSTPIPDTGLNLQVVFSDELNEIAVTLKEIGISIDFVRGDRGKARTITISKMPSSSSASSSNQDQTRTDENDDGLGDYKKKVPQKRRHQIMPKSVFNWSLMTACTVMTRNYIPTRMLTILYGHVLNVMKRWTSTGRNIMAVKLFEYEKINLNISHMSKNYLLLMNMKPTISS